MRTDVRRDPLQALTLAAAAADEPGVPPALGVRLGGVDPLGLRQINFEVMDRLIPGTNNVTRNLRPFVLVTWAWHRARELAREEGATHVDPGRLRDFVDRMEVIFAWSQFLTDGGAELPGRNKMKAFVAATRYKFAGPEWEAFRKAWRTSTSLMAPVNYGPALKALGFLRASNVAPSVMVPQEIAAAAVASFEKKIADRLSHKAFCSLGPVTVRASEVAGWTEGWDLGSSTAAERRMMREALRGATAPAERRAVIDLIEASSVAGEPNDVDELRRLMCDSEDYADPRLRASAELWRYLQVRQLFRLALEGIFDWLTLELRDGPRSSGRLVEAFMRNAPRRSRHDTATEWFRWRSRIVPQPPVLAARLSDALATRDPRKIVPAASDAISFSLTECTYSPAANERPDRLPLARAQRELDARGAGPASDCIRHILEKWVLAQHVYWAVGRGLSDARAGGKTILRLKVVLDERGWQLTPHAKFGPPRLTGDRLAALNQLLEQSRAFRTSSR